MDLIRISQIACHRYQYYSSGEYKQPHEQGDPGWSRHTSYFIQRATLLADYRQLFTGGNLLTAWFRSKGLGVQVGCSLAHGERTGVRMRQLPAGSMLSAQGLLSGAALACFGG